MNILFSPLGMTDPISNFHDGALLHICRHYEINKVYLYMSKEICECNDRDNRYILSLEHLSKKIGRNIEVEIIKKENLEDVYLFDSFLDEFQSLLIKIQENNKDSQIYLNVSSGTPAMKSALQIISTYTDFIPVQVTTPERKSNPHVEDKKNYDVEGQWECNEDNKENAQNRCMTSANINLITRMKKQILVSFINNYDYAGAKLLADGMKESLSETVVELIDGADRRIRLNSSKSFFDKAGLKGVIESNTELEYLLMLDIKVRREEYADFLRAITPLTTVLFEKILKEQCNFDIKDYVDENKKTGDKWNFEKLKQNEKALNVLDKNVDGKNVYTSHTARLISELSDDTRLKELCSKLRKVEQQRNTFAHQIASITEKKIKENLNLDVSEILSMLYKACSYCGFNMKNERNFFKSYDIMNEKIVDTINLK